MTLPVTISRARPVCSIPDSSISASSWLRYWLKTSLGMRWLALSTSSELLQRLHWVALLYGHVKADLAVTGGVHTAEDVLKAMMAGGQVAMMTSALLRHGIDHARKVEEDLAEWMEQHDYESIQQMRGSMSARNVADPAAFERANYMKVLSTYDLRSSAAQ